MSSIKIYLLHKPDKQNWWKSILQIQKKKQEESKKIKEKKMMNEKFLKFLFILTTESTDKTTLKW